MSDPRRERLRELLRAWSYREGDFVLASGRRSRFYVDVRRTSLTAEGAKLIGELLLDLWRDTGWEAAGVGGMSLGADPLTTSLGIAAFDAGVPATCFLVRKEPKGHGAGRQVEAAGDLPDGADVIVLEDTVTTGGSSLRAVEILREAGYRVVGCLAVVDRVEGGREALEAAGVPLRSLFTVADLGSGAQPPSP